MIDAASEHTVAILVISTALLWIHGNIRLSRVGAMLFANWCAQAGYVLLVTSPWFVEGSANTWLSVFAGNYYPWFWLMTIDAVTAWYVLRPPATYTQVFIGAVGIAQILFHGAYAINPLIVGTYSNALDWLGRAQLAALILGGGYGMVGRVYRRFRRSYLGDVALAKVTFRNQGGK